MSQKFSSDLWKSQVTLVVAGGPDPKTPLASNAPVRQQSVRRPTHGTLPLRLGNVPLQLSGYAYLTSAVGVLT